MQQSRVPAPDALEARQAALTARGQPPL